MINGWADARQDRLGKEALEGGGQAREEERKTTMSVEGILLLGEVGTIGGKGSVKGARGCQLVLICDLLDHGGHGVPYAFETHDKDMVMLRDGLGVLLITDVLVPEIARDKKVTGVLRPQESVEGFPREKEGIFGRCVDLVPGVRSEYGTGDGVFDGGKVVGSLRVGGG